MTVSYPKVIQNKLDDLDAEKKRVLGLCEVAKFAETLEANDPDLVQGLSADYWGDKLIVRVYPHSITQLAEFLRLLANKDYRIEKISDHPESQMRSYYLKNSMTVIAHFNIKEDTSDTNEDVGGKPTVSKKCRYVKVGEKRETREIVTPQYELQCDD
jgi:hypothetical protein